MPQSHSKGGGSVVVYQEVTPTRRSQNQVLICHWLCSSQWLQQLRDHLFCKFRVAGSPQRITPDPRTPSSIALPSLPSQMQPSLASLSFIGRGRKEWQMGIQDKPLVKVESCLLHLLWQTQEPTK